MVKKRIGKGLYLKKSTIDGFWLEFKTSTGLHASVNLPNISKGGGIITKAILTWANEQFTTGGKNAS